MLLKRNCAKEGFVVFDTQNIYLKDNLKTETWETTDNGSLDRCEF